jgi:arsenate reductase-like glutaredoxin family protein
MTAQYEWKIARPPPLMPITIYGIKNCDTMKRARARLEKHDVEHASAICKGTDDITAAQMTSLRQIFWQASCETQPEWMM